MELETKGKAVIFDVGGRLSNDAQTCYGVFFPNKESLDDFLKIPCDEKYLRGLPNHRDNDYGFSYDDLGMWLWDTTNDRWIPLSPEMTAVVEAFLKQDLKVEE